MYNRVPKRWLLLLPLLLIHWFQRTEVKEYITLQVNLRQSLPLQDFHNQFNFIPWKKFYLCLKWKQELFFLCSVSLPLFFSYNLENFDCISFAPLHETNNYIFQSILLSWVPRKYLLWQTLCWCWRKQRCWKQSAVLKCPTVQWSRHTDKEITQRSIHKCWRDSS